MPAPDAPPDACLNCGAERLGHYCHACGQHHLDDRLTLRVVWREFAERFLKLERGLAGTTWAALVSPGRLAARYVGGERRRYLNPVSFLLLASAVAVLLLPLYASTDRLENDPMVAVQTDSTRIAASAELGMRMAGADPASLTDAERAEIVARVQAQQEEFFPAYLTAIQQLYSAFSIALALALAGALKLFFGGRAQTYTYAETVVLGCYVAGVYVLVSAVLASALALFAPILVGTLVSVGLIVGYGALAAWGFYERSAGAAALGALSGVLALAVYLVVVVVVAIPLVVFRTL